MLEQLPLDRRSQGVIGLALSYMRTMVVGEINTTERRVSLLKSRGGADAEEEANRALDRLIHLTEELASIDRARLLDFNSHCLEEAMDTLCRSLSRRKEADYGRFRRSFEKDLPTIEWSDIGHR